MTSANDDETVRWGEVSQTPVGNGEREVRPGECVDSIASAAGHFWKTLWDHSDNAELKRVRQDPNILLAGDRITVPEIQLKEVDGATEARHKYKRKGVPAKLRMQVLDDGEPRRNQPYNLDIDGDVRAGVLDGDGRLEESIPLNAKKAILEVGEEKEVHEIDLGHLDPVSTISGIQARLNNLGFDCGAVTGTVDNETVSQLTAFQKKYDLDATGEPDAATRDKLKELHGS